jgi:hypothetical protein
MAITLTDAVRNLANDAVVDSVDGASPGKLKIYEGGVGGTLLITFTLSNPAFEPSGTQTQGSARAIGGDDTNPISAGNPLTATVGTGGTADAYEVTDSADTQKWSGTVTGSGGGGDIQLNNPVLAASQDLDIETWTHSQPA